MKLKTTTVLLLFMIFSNQISHSQENSDLCSCLNVKETEENDAKVIELGQYIQDSFHELSTDGFNEKFDAQSFVYAISNNDNIDKTDEFTRGFMEGIGESGTKLSQEILNSIQAGTYYNLINYRYNIEDRAYYFTFRLFSEETGVNYHDYKVCSDGKNLKFNDIYIYLTGERYTETLQRLFLMLKSSNDSGAFQEDNIKANPLMLILKAKGLAKQQDFKGAYEAISEIDGPMEKEKFILLVKASYASAFNDNIYENILEEFATLYPNDPTLYLKQVDYNIIKGDYDKALENIDKLIYETDDDFLILLKGNAYVLKEDFKNAEDHYRYMTENYPDLLEGYVGYMVSLNFQNRFEDVLTIVKQLITQGYDKDMLQAFLEEKEPSGNNSLEAFVTSSVYQKWKRKS